MRSLLRDRDARVYVAGQVFSMLGDSCLWLAVGIWVKTLTGSNTDAGLTFFFFTAPTVLAPAAGLLVDRVRRRPLLVVTNTFTGAAVLLLLFVHSAGGVWLIYLVMALYGLSYSLLGSAQSALLTVMVPAELLPDVNGSLRTVQESLRLVAPLLGAGLFLLLGAHALAVIDATTFAVAVTSLLMLRVRESIPHPPAVHWLSQQTAGVHHVWRTVRLRQVVIAGAISTTVFGFIEPVTYAIADNGLHQQPAFVGFLVAMQGVGAVVGGSAAAPLLRRIGEGPLVGLALLVASAGVLLQIPSALIPVFAGSVLFGMAIPWLVVALINLTQRLTPSDLQGRAYSAVDTLITVPQTMSIALGAGLIAHTGYRVLLIAMAAVMGVAATYLLTRPEQRQQNHTPAAGDPTVPTP